jgi:hypothetical protein
LLQAKKIEPVMSFIYDQPNSPGSNHPALIRLLPLFPSAKPVNIPVRVDLPGKAKGASEKTTIVFRSHDTAIFFVNYPLNGGDTVQLRASTGPRENPVVVIALMPNGPGWVVAVRFLDEVPKWFQKA